jgi:hypothetical protein
VISISDDPPYKRKSEYRDQVRKMFAGNDYMREFMLKMID